MPLVRIVETRDLSDANRGAIRRLLDQAFEGGFSDDDWLHALGGWHCGDSKPPPSSSPTPPSWNASCWSVGAGSTPATSKPSPWLPLASAPVSAPR